MPSLFSRAYFAPPAAVLQAGQASENRLRGYQRADTRTSLAMGVGSLVVNGAWRLVEVLILGLAAALVPWDLGHGWLAFVVAIVGIDLF